METRGAIIRGETAWNLTFLLCSQRVVSVVAAAERGLWETRGRAVGGSVFQALRKGAGGRLDAAFRSAAVAADGVVDRQ